MTTGQIQAPSAFELWWEKKRKTVTTVLTAILVGVLAYYGWQFFQRRQIDKTWSEFAVNSGLRAGYGEKGDMAGIVQQYPNYFASLYLGSIPSTMITKLGDHVERVDDKGFDDAIAAAVGTPREPLLLWLAANRAIGARSFERAKKLLHELQQKHPGHFLNQESKYPPQFRVDLNEPEPGAQPDPKHVPKLADPISGNVVGLALARIDREEKFVAENKAIYAAPEPDGKSVATVKTDLGEFKIRFFETAAPKHVDTFVRRAKEGYFDGMAIDQIRRAGDNAPVDEAIMEMHFGLASTKQEQDRAKWDEERGKLDSADAIEFEDSRVSHFPMMVAAEAGKEGKSIPTRIWINVSDASREHDGKRVVFGKVVSGEDVARKLVTDPVFSREDERRSGRGAPRDTIRIQSITVE
jgi:cyclophilin family peptidyl-prolyl cis-trans isomerase